MRMHLSLLAAASLLMGGAAFVNCSFADEPDNRTPAQKANDAMERDKPNPPQANADDAKAIRKTLAETVNAALTKGGFDDLCERLTKEDQTRFGKTVEAKHDDLDGRIAQFQKDWKDKYGHEFDITKNWENIFTDQTAMIYEGETNIRLLSEMGGTTRPSTMPKEEKAGGGVTDQERNVAAVVIPKGDNLPELIVRLQNEGNVMNAWRISVPQSVSGEQVKDTLMKHLTAADNPAQWPADENQAYRVVAHHVLMALANPPAKEGMEKGMDHMEHVDRPGMGR